MARMEMDCHTKSCLWFFSLFKNSLDIFILVFYKAAFRVCQKYLVLIDPNTSKFPWHSSFNMFNTKENFAGFHKMWVISSSQSIDCTGLRVHLSSWRFRQIAECIRFLNSHLDVEEEHRTCFLWFLLKKIMKKAIRFGLWFNLIQFNSLFHTINNIYTEFIL